MSKPGSPHVCPAGLSGTLDNVLRRWLHKPRKILEPYVMRGMTVLDLGCGPGYFTAELAKLTGEEGKVVAADLQQKMLEKVLAKIRGTVLEKRIRPHLCQEDSIGVTEKVDFVLAFWMVHEVPDQQRMFEEIRSLLKPGGRIFVIEPMMHVTGKAFEKMVGRAEAAGLVVAERPKVTISRAVLLKEDKR